MAIIARHGGVNLSKEQELLVNNVASEECRPVCKSTIAFVDRHTTHWQQRQFELPSMMCGRLPRSLRRFVLHQPLTGNELEAMREAVLDRPSVIRASYFRCALSQIIRGFPYKRYDKWRSSPSTVVWFQTTIRTQSSMARKQAVCASPQSTAAELFSAQAWWADLLDIQMLQDAGWAIEAAWRSRKFLLRHNPKKRERSACWSRKTPGGHHVCHYGSEMDQVVMPITLELHKQWANSVKTYNKEVREMKLELKQQQHPTHEW